MIVSVTKRLEFDAAHRLINHNGKCRNLHGHRYAAELTVTADKLDQMNMILDFGKIKEEVGGWIDKFWDHNVLLHENDPLRRSVYEVAMAEGLKLPYMMMENPTAEAMASHLYTVANTMLEKYEIRVMAVRLYETPTCWADATI